MRAPANLLRAIFYLSPTAPVCHLIGRLCPRGKPHFVLKVRA